MHCTSREVVLPAVSLTSSPTLIATLSPKFSVESLRNFTTMDTKASTDADDPVNEVMMNDDDVYYHFTMKKKVNK